MAAVLLCGFLFFLLPLFLLATIGLGNVVAGTFGAVVAPILFATPIVLHYKNKLSRQREGARPTVATCNRCGHEWPM